MAIRMMGMPKANIRTRVPVAIINVKPYYVIMCGTKISCDGESGLPLVFDTFDLAEFYVQDNGLTDCVIKRLELEELVHKCRDRKVPFDSFMLINKLSQL
jgi:hypothetical protein